jgi:hypothetical protein
MTSAPPDSPQTRHRRGVSAESSACLGLGYKVSPRIASSPEAARAAPNLPTLVGGIVMRQRARRARTISLYPG